MKSSIPSGPRHVRVSALAKINLSLRVLNKRQDGFHELRTIFQTISLADRIGISFEPASRTKLEINSSIDIEDNLVIRAARLIMGEMRMTGRVGFELEKRIPMGGGLGGGSSDAAAVLLALPVLAGRDVALDRLSAVAAELGSDVPSFLLGGTVLGLGRGTELHPLPEMPSARGLLVCPDVAVPTPEAYRALDRELTSGPDSNNMNNFQALSWSLGHGLSAEEWARLGENDFEPYVFSRYPQLAEIHRQLLNCGASPAMLSGSGASLFGIFAGKEAAVRAVRSFRGQRVESFYLVSRARYRGMWWRSLLGCLRKKEWPPRSRYME